MNLDIKIGTGAQSNVYLYKNNERYSDMTMIRLTYFMKQ